MGTVKWKEVRKARFIREYRALCERFNMMVVMSETITDEDGEEWKIGDPGVEIDPQRYLAFCVANIKKAPQDLTAAIEEMLIEDIMEIEVE
jgi:hypothetical protein